MKHFFAAKSLFFCFFYLFLCSYMADKPQVAVALNSGKA